jgi:hypothetical protein
VGGVTGVVGVVGDVVVVEGVDAGVELDGVGVGEEPLFEAQPASTTPRERVTTSRERNRIWNPTNEGTVIALANLVVGGTRLAGLKRRASIGSIMPRRGLPPRRGRHHPSDASIS